ncbi:MAG: DUF1461 domain-containing protein [Desulfobacterales bacterium]|nr:DUF1461 domain-containing protein [Desulfobacterales bacterium]
MRSCDSDKPKKWPLPLRWGQKLLLGLCLLYLSVYIPIFGVLYFPFWYEINCHWHDRCERFGDEKAVERIHELVAYMRHAGELSGSDWTLKERRHLEEVRRIFDHLFFAVIVAGGLLILLFRAKTVRRAGIGNIILLLCLCGILPFFGYFWRDIFHELLFGNALWKNSPHDVSYYIMPRVFFKHTMMLVIGMAIFINGSLFLGAGRLAKK